ncbi:MAG: DUF2207 domain-containing protein [Coriobacteriia bacterium]|nr:DUF2207 domain-containing protein [Coriobacteriia bacterium]
MTGTTAPLESYTVQWVDIRAQVGADASLHVVEQRALSFESYCETVSWAFATPSDNAFLHINSVSVIEPGEAPIDLVEVFSSDLWQPLIDPKQRGYAIDYENMRLVVLLYASDVQLTLEVDYIVDNGAQAYRDTAELAWAFVSSPWEVSLNNVTMTVSLPCPPGSTVVPNANTWAWVHGPQDGSLKYNGDNSITYHVDKIKTGQSAESHVLFDVAWLTDLVESDLHQMDEGHFAEAFRAELLLIMQAGLARVQEVFPDIAYPFVSALAVVWAVNVDSKHKRNYPAGRKPASQYQPDDQSQLEHPAVISRLWNNNRQSPKDLTATVMHLSQLGAVQVRYGVYTKVNRLGTSKQFNDYCLVRIPSQATKLTHQIDVSAMTMLFDKIGGGSDILYFQAIKDYRKHKMLDNLSVVQDWQDELSLEVADRELFENREVKVTSVLYLISAAYLILSFVFIFFWQGLIPIIVFCSTSAALMSISLKEQRRSPEGSEIFMKCKALAKRLKGASSLEYQPSNKAYVPEELMVYAHIFGVTQQAIRTLSLNDLIAFQNNQAVYIDQIPEAYSRDRDPSETSSPLPWWIWYAKSNIKSRGKPSVGEVFQASSSPSLIMSFVTFYAMSLSYRNIWRRFRL